MKQWVLVLLGLACALPSAAQQPAGTISVGTSGDYAPFSVIAEDGARAGFEIDLVQAFAEQHGYEIEWVPFRWPELANDLRSGRFHVAASGVTVRADRALLGGFTVPIAETGAVVLARQEAELADTDLKRPGLRMAVNEGGHLERVSRLLFPAADLRAIPDNAAVLAALEAGEVDAIVTDSAEAVRWGESPISPIRFGPFTRDRKAWLVAGDQPELARQMNAWLVDQEADGTLARLRKAHALPDAGRPALALNALVTAIAERLALMPAVAEAKRLTGSPIQVPEREVLVVARAVADSRAAAIAAGLPGAEDAAVEAFFTELIAAARAVQEAALAGPAADPAAVPDLVEELRPALLRIGARIGVLLPRLPAAIATEAVDAEFARSLDLPGFDATRRQQLVQALAELASAPRR
jgi:cyclohexadienyl dehydratase